MKDSKSECFNEVYKLVVFHVGQGMCALVHNEKIGVFFDCGAGTPIKKVNYGKTCVKTNELKAITDKLKYFYVFVSHSDSDHWRILGWDKSFLDKVKSVYISSNSAETNSSRFLAFRDKTLKDKVRVLKQEGFLMVDFNFNCECSDDCNCLDDHIRHSEENIEPTDNCFLFFHSSPSKYSEASNNNCMVGVYYKKVDNVFRRALFLGDYLYMFAGCDKGEYISGLIGDEKGYDFVMVPHHGASESAEYIVNPVCEQSIAFFSAGNHKTYRHPRCISLDAHENKEFTCITNEEHICTFSKNQEISGYDVF